jgi:hypothetical protein
VDQILDFAGQNMPKKGYGKSSFLVDQITEFAGQNMPKKAKENPAF